MTTNKNAFESPIEAASNETKNEEVIHNSNKPSATNNSGLSRDSSTSQALALIAVDGIRPSDEAIELMHAIDRGEITHDEAIQILLRKYKC